jgi:sulfite exporter TauE/SafE
MVLLGLLGTGHCLGMCGPLVIAFPGRAERFTPHLWYHAGRLTTYAVLGGIMGAIGQGVEHMAGLTGGDPALWVPRTQIALSVIASLFLLVFGMARIGLIREPDWLAAAAPSHIPGFNRVAKAVSRSPDSIGLAVVGLAMGLLPCGLSYAAFARALAVSGPAHGALMTFAFGLGTLPGLLILGTGISVVARRYRRHCDLLSGVLMVAMALNLGLDAAAAIR